MGFNGGMRMSGRDGFQNSFGVGTFAPGLSAHLVCVWHTGRHLIGLYPLHFIGSFDIETWDLSGLFMCGSVDFTCASSRGLIFSESPYFSNVMLVLRAFEMK